MKKENEEAQKILDGIKGFKDLLNTLKQLFEDFEKQSEPQKEEFVNQVKLHLNGEVIDEDFKGFSTTPVHVSFQGEEETQEPIVINNYGTINIIDGKNFRVIDKLFEGDNDNMVD